MIRRRLVSVASRACTILCGLFVAAIGSLAGSSYGSDWPSCLRKMAPLIAEFIQKPERSSPLSAWWMPWLVNLGSLPFVLIFGGIVGEVALRKLGVLEPVVDDPAA